MTEDPASKRGVDPARELGRCLRERLEISRLFGWEVPLRGAPPSRPRADTAPAGRPAQPLAAPRPPASEAAAPRVREKPRLGAGRIEAAGGAAERQRRAELLEPLRSEVLACQLCGLGKTRTQAVFGVGDPLSRLMFVGEAPGFDEDRRGEPFVGRAGKLLDDIIRAMGLAREEVYIANVIKCRPPNNRTPDPEEIGFCTPYLDKQIAIVDPEIICALGAVAARSLLKAFGSLASLRGRFHDFQGRKVRVTYHPAYLLRNPADKRKTWEDVQTIMAALEIG